MLPARKARKMRDSFGCGERPRHVARSATLKVWPAPDRLRPILYHTFTVVLLSLFARWLVQGCLGEAIAEELMSGWRRHNEERGGGGQILA
jgi:hypothetical protein